MVAGAPAVLGLFPGCVAAGGIQASGRIAWEAISRCIPATGRHLLFCYGDRGPTAHANRQDGIHIATRQGAIFAALRTTGHFRIILVWHLDLLKLLPFFRTRDAKVVVILQGIEAWRRRSWLERRLLRQVDLFVSISDYTWRRFAAVYPEHAAAPHYTVPLGVDSPSQRTTQQPGCTPAALMIGRLARREDYKGHRQMLEAWPLVRQRIKSAELQIAGEGDLRPELERLAIDLGISHAVHFLGFVSEERKLELLAQSYCMALPSRGEGFGLVYLEALRLGRPCLVSSLDAGVEVVAPPLAGLAVDPEDRASVADAACRLLSPGPEWEEWSTNARERYERHFTAHHYQQRLLSVLGISGTAA